MEIKEKFLKLTLAILVLFCVSITPILLTEEVSAATNSYEYQVLDLMNKERSKVGVTPLKMDNELFNAAKTRVGELKIKFSHTRPDGSLCYTVSPKVRGENIASGQTTPQEVMKTWMNSQLHRENILNHTFKTVGIGHIKGNPSYWVQLFGVKKASEIGNKQGKPGTPSLSLVSGNNKIILKWKKVPNVSGYQVYTSTKKNGKYVLKKTITKGNIVQLTDKNLKKKKYYYKIRSYVKKGKTIEYSAFSSIKSKTPK